MASPFTPPTIPGGGGTPAGDDTQVQFNDAGAFGASDNLTFTVGGLNSTLGICADVNGVGTITAVGLGAQLFLVAPAGPTGQPGGEVSILSGSSDGGTGGVISIVAGNDSADGEGGSVSIASGRSATWDGGDINIRGNPLFSSGRRGGDINIVAGQGDVHGGNVVVQAGASDGNVQVYSGSGQYVQLDSNGLHIGADKLGFFGEAAVVKPNVGAVPTALSIATALVALGLVDSS